jgi:outer membrane protein
MAWMKKRVFVLLLIFLALRANAVVARTPVILPPQEPSPEKPQENKKLLHLDIDTCLDISLKNNHRRPASKFAMEVAEAQHKQALSAYWPQLSLRSLYSQLDQDPNFIFPARSIPVPAQTATIPANSFGPGVPPAPVPVTTPASQFNVPQQNVKLFDKHNLLTSLNLTYPLYTGGLRSAKVNQAEKGIEVAKQEVRRTELQIIYDTKKMYYGAVLAKRVLQIAKDTLGRLETTLQFTENLYKAGSGKVKKTDYLKNKAIVESTRSMVALLENNEKLAKAGLINTMGLQWQAAIALAAQEIPYSFCKSDLSKLVGTAYQFNPDWAKLKAGLEAAQAKIREERSGHLPTLALTGSLNHIANPYDQGLATARNKDSWAVGIVLELPIFSGFLTQNKIKAARANLEKIKEEKVLLREGIALQVKDTFLRLVRAQQQQKAAKEAMLAATENRELNERAYENELVETKDVLEAQLMESSMEAEYQKILYDHIEAQAHLELIVGTEVNKLIDSR